MYICVYIYTSITDAEDHGTAKPWHVHEACFPGDVDVCKACSRDTSGVQMVTFGALDLESSPRTTAVLNSAAGAFLPDASAVSAQKTR